MPKVLNQNELDALLHMVEAEGGEDESGTTASESTAPGSRGYNVVSAEAIQPVDFTRQDRLSPDQLASLQVLHENFASEVTASLSGYLRTVVNVRLISVEQFTYSEFTMSVPSPTVFNSLSCTPLPGNMILEMNPSIVFPFIDRLLGGDSNRPSVIERPFTQIEQLLINSIVLRLLDHLAASWNEIEPITFNVVETETNPSLMQIVAPNEPVILYSFEATMAGHSGLFNLCTPFRVIEPLANRLTQTRWSTTPEAQAPGPDRDRLLENLRGVSLDHSVILAEVALPLTDLLSLEPGDILDLDTPSRTDVTVQVEGKAAFRGKPARHRNRRAVILERPIDPRESMV